MGQSFMGQSFMGPEPRHANDKCERRPWRE